VQGRLREEHLSARIETKCGHCGRSIEFTMDSEMKIEIHDGIGELLVFLPQVNWDSFSEPNIIHAY
jgi:hypothetical protein